MSILSVSFLAFLVLLTAIYHIVPGKVKPYILLAGSIFFYLSFDMRYSLFLLFTVISTYACGILTEKAEAKERKKLYLIITLLINIAILIVVKYLPYTVSLIGSAFGKDFSAFKLLVPIGISFYTLQTVGYCIDVYRGDIKAEKNFFKYSSFATFFPLILQGPISRYSQLADQLFSKKKANDLYRSITFGSQLMLWGFFKKLVIADRAAILVNTVFDNHTEYTALPILAAALLYTVQIYTDFSGCVDICRGAGELFGINIIDNFRQPYFATSIPDFWRRWHISLSSWLRDYVYIPLGGNRKGKARKYLNIFIVFLVSGFWHGVGLQYIAWGILHGVYQIAGGITMPMRKKLCSSMHINRESVPYKLFQQLFTFALIVESWIFFRSDSVTTALRMTKRLIFNWDSTPLSSLLNLGLDVNDFIILAVSLVLLFTVSVLRAKKIPVREKTAKAPLPIRWIIYLAVFMAVLVFGIYGPGYSDASFIYMNF